MSIVREALKKVEISRRDREESDVQFPRRPVAWVWPVSAFVILTFIVVLTLRTIGLRLSGSADGTETVTPPRGGEATDEPRSPPAPKPVAVVVSAPPPAPPVEAPVQAVEPIQTELAPTNAVQADETPLPEITNGPPPIASLPPAEPPAVATDAVRQPDATQASTPETMTLTGIAYSPKTRLALIDGQMIREGQDIEGYRVTSIQRTSVTLERDGKEYVLTAKP